MAGLVRCHWLSRWSEPCAALRCVDWWEGGREGRGGGGQSLYLLCALSLPFNLRSQQNDAHAQERQSIGGFCSILQMSPRSVGGREENKREREKKKDTSTARKEARGRRGKGSGEGARKEKERN